MTGTEARLRDALASGAAAVDPSPEALSVIRTRIAARRGRRRRMALAGAATLATSLAVTAAVVTLRTPSQPLPDAVGPATRPTSVAPGSGGPAASRVPDGPAVVPSGSARLPVYWVGDDRGSARRVLYREFRTLPVPGATVPGASATGSTVPGAGLTGSAAAGATAGPVAVAGRVRAAVTEAVSGGPLDPDYRTGWPAGVSVRDVEVGPSAVTVDLTGLAVDAANPDGAAAVRQLVWTVTAVSDLPGVKLRVDGAALDTLWSAVPVGGTLSRADADRALAPVWLISPQQGDTVATSFDVQVAGFVPDGRVRVRLRDATGTLVLSREATLDRTSPHQGVALLRVILPPGGYAPGTATLSAVPAGSPSTSADDHLIVLPG